MNLTTGKNGVQGQAIIEKGDLYYFDRAYSSIGIYPLGQDTINIHITGKEPLMEIQTTLDGHPLELHGLNSKITIEITGGRALLDFAQ